MTALVTGASSGIGRDMAIELSKMGYELILVARSESALKSLQNILPNHSEVIVLDLSSNENCFFLYSQVKGKNIDILINNAGVGVFGNFIETDLDKELSMIQVNLNGVHILTKLFLKDFVSKNSGYILNVSSSAAFLPGPLMGSYYASKAYVLHLTESIYEELRQKKSSVYIGALCPGPVDTNFNKTAGVGFSIKALASEKVAKYAIKMMFKRKLLIIPGVFLKMSYFFIRFVPTKVLLKITYYIQYRKRCYDAQ